MNPTSVKKEILRNIGEIMDSYPQYTMAEHLVHILRPKGGKKPYRVTSSPDTGWDDQYLLKQIENYRSELIADLSGGLSDDSDNELFP